MDKKNFGWSLTQRDSKTIEQLMPFWEFLYKYYFRVETSGWENIPEGQVLLVGSHNGGIAAPDMVMMMYDWFKRFGTDRLAYGLMHPLAWTAYQSLTNVAAKTGAIRANPKMAIAAIEKGATILVYPGGAEDVFRPYTERNKIKLVGRKGFIKLALRYSLPIVPLISKGAHESIVVLGDLYEQAKELNKRGLFPWIFDLDPKIFPIYLGLPWGLALGPLPNIPLPIPMTTRVCPPIYFDRYGIEASKDKDYLTECYDLVVNSMQKELDRLYS
ncbi:lysophospholipid acyltransferase family protein [Geminocystis sp. NIES-3709]|uniref:lysophospholipid acyltransferase family protein n=1 Tax=Geminocystis sp. NIES-3709 TaxID=1617448 RepID=UPI0005FC59DA|nr:lysophospholipid acyltransferase family protein [Geminocystis sp. NIES-3709]BAQ64053.1 acyltransferase family protein [Geminocystis sp. NIES-3709]